MSKTLPDDFIIDGGGHVRTPAPTPGFAPSRYQAAILNWVQRGSGSALVEAVAGSGKTTTLKMICGEITGSALFLAFNKHVAEELAMRLPAHVSVSTIHSLGRTALAGWASRQGLRLEIRYDKLRNVVTSWLEQALLSRSPERNLVYGLTDLAELCQLTLTDPSDEAALVRLINHHDAAVPEGVPGSLSAALTGILARSLEATKTSGHITFADMLWLPAKLGVTPTTYQWVLVDECQDLSAAQLELALSAVAPKGRLIFVGDRHQAIYGFAGADNASVDKILDRTGATRFPLSTCFRCPSTHLDLARELVPQIENRPDAPPGVVQYVTGSSFLDTVEAGDLVLCRTTAPLIQACWELIRAGKAAHVKGRDIGKGLVTFVDRALKASRRPFSEAHEALRVFGEREAAKLAKVDGADLKLSALWDKVDACAHLLSASRATTPAEFSGWVDSLFADGSKGVLLSTVHKAKGLEADRVWLLRPDLMPHPKAADGWQQDQELNLKYVALTRSKDFLGIVAPPRRDY